MIMNQQSVLYKKVFGCLMGGIIGDAFGGPIEMMHANYIRELHGGVVTELISYRTRPDGFMQPGIPGAYAWSDKPGTYTDDSYFSLLNARCIIDKGGRINCDDLGEFWARECDIDHGWRSLQASYWKLIMTMRPARTLGQGNIGDNSSAMCIGPIGIINACDPYQASLDAYDVVSLMHDEHSREAAGIIAAAVAEAFKPDATVDSIVEAAINNIPGGQYSRMYKPMLLAVDLARRAKDYEELTKLYYDQLIIEWRGRGRNEGDGRHALSCEAYESIPCAVGMFLNAGGDFVKTVVGSANFGRDCDTIACMAGYIAGAYNGIDGIPARWVDTCIEANPDPDPHEIAVGLTNGVLNERKKLLDRIEMINSLQDKI